MMASKKFCQAIYVTGVTRDKEYNRTAAMKKPKAYLTVNPNGEAEVVKIILTPGSSAHKRNSIIILSSGHPGSQQQGIT